MDAHLWGGGQNTEKKTEEIKKIAVKAGVQYFKTKKTWSSIDTTR